MVAACEALKVNEPLYRNHNVYHVVEALLGKERADMLRWQSFKPQDVRSRHLHAGELIGSEFAQHVMISSFQDPTFDQAYEEMWWTTKAAIIEWLRRGGAFVMPPWKRRKQTWKRWLKDNVLLVLLGAAALSFLIGRLV
jgi:hypothetical protein